MSKDRGGCDRGIAYRQLQPVQAKSDWGYPKLNIRLLPVLLVLLFGCWGTLPARAQEPLPAAGPGTAQGATPTLSQADIDRLLGMLKNDAQRADFVATLEALRRAGGTQPPAQPEQLLPLPPDSLGAQLLLGLSGRIDRFSGQALATLRSLYDLPGLVAWFQAVWESPWMREKALDACLKVLLLLAVGLAGRWLARKLLAPLYRRLGAADHRRLPRRILCALGRFLLDLVPVAAFMAATYAVIVFASPQLTTRLILLSVNNAIIVVGLAMCVVRALLSPDAPSLRPVPFSDATAAWLEVWVRRIVAVAIFGFVAGEAGLVLGMDAITHAFVGKIVWLVVSVLLVLLVVQCRRGVCMALRAPDDARGLWAITRNRAGDFWHVIAIIYVVAAWLVLALEIPNGFQRMLQVSIASFIVIGIAKGLESLLERTLDSYFQPGEAATPDAPGIAARVGRYLPLLRRLAAALLWVLALLLLFEVWGLSPLAWFTSDALGGRLLAALFSIGVTLLVALVVWEMANAGIERHLATLAKSAQTAKSARARTLMPMLRTTLMVAILVAVGIAVLSEVGVNVAPLLAGAGVIGIAVGFGSQKLVQDVITGAFLLFEDAIAVGDVVALGGQSGVVENLTVRSIRLRALDGSIHIIPFSAVTTVTNMTRDYGYAVFDIGVSYGADPDKVATVLRDIGKEMREEDRWAAIIREPLEVMGVEKLADSAVIVRARFKTDPGGRWAVNREFLRRVKQRFDAEGIEIPFPARKVVVEGPPGMSAAVRDAAAAAGAE